MRQKNTKDEKYNSNKISTSRTYTHLLVQHDIKNKNDINSSIDTPTNTYNQTHTVHKERTFHIKTTIMGNNGSVSNYKNVIISASRNHNHKKEYRIMNPIPIKDKNNEGTRVANKNIQCNKESISTSNAYSDE